MKKKFTAILITAAICINGTLTVIADDKSDIMKDVSDSDIEQMHGSESYIGDDGEFYTTEKLAIDLGYSKDDIIELYWLKDKIVTRKGQIREEENRLVDILQDNDTVYDFISDEKSYYILTKSGGKVVGTETVRKGKPYEIQEKAINERTDLTEEARERRLEYARKTADKWYISASQTFDDCMNFLAPSEVEEKLAKENITNVEDIKYIAARQHIGYAVIIKTNTEEYIIPLCTRSDIDGVVNGELYTTKEFKPLVENIDEKFLQKDRERSKTTPTLKVTATPKPTAKPTETPEPTEKPTVSPKPTATPTATATPQPTAKPDCSSWAASDIENAVSQKILPQDMQSGYTKLIDRADFCRIAYNMLDISGKAENVNNGTHFDDISMKEIYMLSGMGIINGKGENKFAPNDNITREEAAAILSRMVSYLKLNLPEQSGSNYSDDGEISDWAKENVYDVKKLGVMQGVDGNKFDPKSGYTKEQAIVTIMRVMKNIK